MASLTLAWAWTALAALLGLAVGQGLHRVIEHLPGRMAAAWRREALDVMDLSTGDIPACAAIDPPASRALPTQLITAIATASIVWKFGPGVAAAAGLALTWTLIVLAGVDARTQLLPDQLTLPLLWLGLLLAVKSFFITAPASILGAGVGYGGLWALSKGCKLLTGQEGMGMGDFKLLAALGAWMGPVALLPIGLMASALSVAINGTQILLRTKDRATPFPFGPYLALAGWLWFLVGNTLWPTWLSAVQRL